MSHLVCILDEHLTIWHPTAKVFIRGSLAYVVLCTPILMKEMHPYLVGVHAVAVFLREQLGKGDIDGERDDGDTDGI